MACRWAIRSVPGALMYRNGMRMNGRPDLPSDIKAVNQALADELAQPRPNEAVVASCRLFKSVYEAKTGGQHDKEKN